MATLFSKIISGEIPSYKVYEDDNTYAFLDIYPQQYGQTLIVPKLAHNHFYDLPEPYYSAIFATAKILTSRLKSFTQAERIGLIIEGFQVPHVHIKLIPVNQAGDLYAAPYEATQDELKTVQDSYTSAGS